MTTAWKEYAEQAREGFGAGLFVLRYLSQPDRAYTCPRCTKAMNPRCFGDTAAGNGIYGFACNNCHTLMMAEAENCLDAAEKLGVLA